MKIRLRTVTAGALIAMLALIAMVAVSIHRAGDPSHLDRTQWRRLTERFAQRAQRLRSHYRITPAVSAVFTPVPISYATPTPIPVTRAPQSEPDPEVMNRQAAEYAADQPKSIIELQQLRSTQRSPIQGRSGRTGFATLFNLNPIINDWYVLQLQWSDGSEEQYHLVNSYPKTQDLELAPEYHDGIVLVDSVTTVPCQLWSEGVEPLADRVEQARTPYVLLCNDRVVLRLPTAGNKTTLEWSTDFLRDNVWGGEKLTVLVRKTLFKDRFLATSELSELSELAELDRSAVTERQASVTSSAEGPRPLRIDPDLEGFQLEPIDLGLTLDTDNPQWLTIGQWYPVGGSPGVFVSIIQPGLVAPDILAGYPNLANPLDEVERAAQTILVAFDLERFDLGFSIGTDHPRVGWSERVREEMRITGLPGPDGINGIEPLVATGIIPPAIADRVVATFTGGFKRGHGAFKSSPLASQNHGSHYGFVESGVVLSKLQPGLATLFVTDNRQVGMKTWRVEDQALLPRIHHARQNGVALVETDPDTGAARPGALVARWGLGNWSGSQDQRLRTLRAGACLQESTGHHRFLIYGYFSSVTPSAMARVFQACDCRYAMQLDINALEHTYLALYRAQHNELVVEHLITGMEVLDKTVNGQVLPRFLGFADNRDFFFLLRRINGSQPLPATGDTPPENGATSMTSRTVSSTTANVLRRP